jgi:hypothetical protein
MVQSELDIIPTFDQRYNDIWSNNLDSLAIPFGEEKVLMGSRDSFIHLIKVKNKTVELTP